MGHRDLDPHLGEERLDGLDGAVGPLGPEPQQAEDRAVVRVLGEARAAVEGHVGGRERGFEQRGVLAAPVEDDGDAVGVCGGHGVEDRVDDVGLGVEDVERRGVEGLLGEQVDPLGVGGETRSLQGREQLGPDDGDGLVGGDLVLGELPRGGGQRAQHVDDVPGRFGDVGVVLEDRVA